MRKIFIDVETYSPVDIVINGAFNYLKHKDAEITCCCYAIDDGDIMQGFPEIRDSDVIIAHNAIFDYVALTTIQSLQIRPDQVLCTMSMAGQIGYSTSLNVLAKTLGFGVKMEEGKSLINRNDLSEEETLQLIKYCKKDVQLLRNVFNKLNSFCLYTKKCHRSFTNTFIMNLAGVPIDRDLLSLCIESLSYAQPIIENEFIQMTRKIIERDNLVCDLSKYTREDTRQKRLQAYRAGFDHNKKARIKDMLGVQTLDKRKWAKIDKEVALLNDTLKSKLWETYKKVSYSSLTKILKIRNFIEEDDRIRGQFIWHGAHTGRIKSKGVQFQNLTRKINASSQSELSACIAELNTSNDPYRIYDILSGMPRHLIRSEKGLCIFDYKSIELYIARSIAEDPVPPGLDVYIDFATKIFDADYKDVSKDQRNIAKISILSCQYGTGPKTLREAFENYGLNIDFDFAQKLVMLYRNTNKKTVKKWATLGYDAKKAIQGRKKIGIFDCTDPSILKMNLPSGRKIGFLNPLIDSGGCIIYDQGFAKEKLYGGKLFNYVCQGSGFDLLSDSIKLLSKADNLIMQVHDELVIEDFGNYESTKSAMESKKEFLQDCILIAEGNKENKFYTKC